jgi:hypothetical protein
MASKARMEYGKIKRASTILEKKLYSSDPEVAKKARAQLKVIAKQLRAWAKKHRVKLYRHVETHPRGEARRRCKAQITPLINRELMKCMLIGQSGRNCLYECSIYTVDPF